MNELPPHGIFLGDNLFAFGRSLGFLDDRKFFDSVERHTETNVEKSVVWRTHVLCWAARRALRLEGDFIECGCYRGISARIVAEYTDLATTDKKFYLYDLFEHSPDMNHQSMPAHSPQLFDEVRGRFADMSNVTVIQGGVPASFAQGAAQKIAFLHVDVNNVPAEIGALETLFDRVTPGAAIVLDDYGWLAYHEQKTAEDRFFAERGLQVLELPTGQVLVIV